MSSNCRTNYAVQPATCRNAISEQFAWLGASQVKRGKTLPVDWNCAKPLGVAGSTVTCATFRSSWLGVDMVVETKLAFKLVKTNGQCSTVHEKFLIVLVFLVTTTSTDPLASKGTLNL